MKGLLRGSRSFAVLILVALGAGLFGCGRSRVTSDAARLIAGNQPEEAYQVLLSHAEKHPRDGDGLRLLAATAASLGHDAVAARALDQAEALGDSDRRKSRKVRRDLWHARYVEARAVLDTPEQAEGPSLAAALDQLRRAAVLDPENASTWAARAEVLLYMGRRAEADSSFARAVERAADDAESRGNVMDSLLRSADYLAGEGDVGAAVTLTRSAHDLQPDDVRTLYALGVNLHRLAQAEDDTSRYREAASLFRSVLEKLPDDADARYNLALTHYRLGGTEAAMREVTRLIHDNPLRPEGYRLFSRLARENGSREEALGATVARRALEGESVPVPETALGVTSVGGRDARKAFVLEGAPTRIYQYTEKQGVPVEVWFYVRPPRVLAYADGRLIAELASSGDSR